MRGSLGTNTVPVPPPFESDVNVGAVSGGNAAGFDNDACAVNVADGAFCAATATVSAYAPTTGAASNAAKPCRCR